MPTKSAASDFSTQVGVGDGEANHTSSELSSVRPNYSVDEPAKENLPKQQPRRGEIN